VINLHIKWIEGTSRDYSRSWVRNRMLKEVKIRFFLYMMFH